MWYTNYLETYEKPYEEIPQSLIDEVREKIAQKESDAPIISVVAIAHNEERHIVSCLHSLADNIVDVSIELVVVNDASDDHTEELLERLGVRHFYESRKSPGYARQCGLDHARGKYHLCIDADTIYPPHYIQTLYQALNHPGTACAYGLWSFLPDANMSRFGLFFYESLRDLYLILQQWRRPELNVRGMVFSFKTELGRKYGFRTDIIRGEDGSLALNMKQDGRLKFVLSRKARPITNSGTVGKDGGLGGMFYVRLKKALSHLVFIFTTQNKYEDQDDNIMSKKSN